MNQKQAPSLERMNAAEEGLHSDFAPIREELTAESDKGKERMLNAMAVTLAGAFAGLVPAMMKSFPKVDALVQMIYPNDVTPDFAALGQKVSDSVLIGGMSVSGISEVAAIACIVCLLAREKNVVLKPAL